MEKYKPTFENNLPDIIAFVTKSLGFICSIVGGLAAKAVDYIIQNQKLDRAIYF